MGCQLQPKECFSVSCLPTDGTLHGKLTHACLQATRQSSGVAVAARGFVEPPCTGAQASRQSRAARERARGLLRILDVLARDVTLMRALMNNYIAEVVNVYFL